MKATPQDLQKVQHLSFEDAYFKIKNYYSKFIEEWFNLNYSQKKNYIFGNNRQGNVEFVDKSNSIIHNLTDYPTLNDAIGLAKNVINGDLEYSYHDLDNNEIKMGVYAHHIINTFNGGKLF